MKRAKKPLRPRNRLAATPLLKKGGAHARRDKRAARALQSARLRKDLRQI